MSGDGQQRHLIELAALYAAGALSGEESAAVDARLASGDEELRAAILAFSGVIEALASAGPIVSPRPESRRALLDRIKAALRDPSSADQSGGSRPPTPEKRNRRARRAARPAGAAPDATADKTGELVVLRGADAVWTRLAEGIETRTLFVDRRARRVTLLGRLAPGAVYPAHFHSDDEECLVLEGDLHVGELALLPGDYQRAPKGSWHGEQRTRAGCVCLIIAPLSVFSPGGS